MQGCLQRHVALDYPESVAHIRPVFHADAYEESCLRVGLGNYVGQAREAEYQNRYGILGMVQSLSHPPAAALIPLARCSMAPCVGVVPQLAISQ